MSAAALVHDCARRDCAIGVMAIHPARVPVINAAFTPTAEKVAHAREVVALFEADPTLSVAQRLGKMIDKPHLTLAQAIGARAGT